MSTSRSPHAGRGHMNYRDIVGPMNYLAPGPSNMTIPSANPRSDANFSFPTLPTCNNDGVKTSSPPKHQTPDVMSIEEMHKCYINNKAELTKHVSVAAGAREKLWGGDGWFIKWYEMPSPINDTVPTDKDTDVVIVPERKPKAKINGHASESLNKIDLIKTWRDVSWQDTHNLVEHVNIPAHVTAGAVKNIVARFADNRRRFSWVVGPQEQPIVETILRNAQMWCEETAPALSAVLGFRDDLFCKASTQPAPSQVLPLPPTRIEDSDTLPSRERIPRLPRSEDVLIAQFEALGRAAAGEAAWPGRRPAYTQKFTNGPELVSNYSRPQNSLQTTSSQRQAQTIECAPQKTEATQSKNGTIGAKQSDLETAVGDFENLNIADASPGHAERLRTLPDGTILHLLTDRSEVGEWVRTWAYEADPESANVRHWTRIYSTLVDKLPPNQFRMFAARKPDTFSPPPTEQQPQGQQDFKTGQMIGTGYVHLYSGVASIHCITVLPKHRSRGLGGALTRYAMGIGKDMGLGMAMLTASTMASSYGEKAAIFSQLSFKEFGRVKQYVYRPMHIPPPSAAVLDAAKVREAEDEGWEWVGQDDDDSD